MNRYTAEAFSHIKRAAKTYQQDITTALQKYRQAEQDAKEDSKAYKDEAGVFNAKMAAAKSNARNAAQMAENVFTGEVGAQIKSLREDLHKHLLTAPDSKFLASLNVYATYGFAPGKAEITALMEQAGGNSLALRALDAVLKNTGSKYRVDVPGAEDFEKDISALERLTEGHLMWAPKAYHHEATSVFKGTPRLTRREDGSYYDGGYRWDSTSILISDTDFEGRIAALDQMADRWTANVLPTVYDADTYKGHTDPKTGDEITGAQEFIDDYRATAQAGEIVESADARVEAVRQKAQERAATMQRAQATIDHYTKWGAV